MKHYKILIVAALCLFIFSNLHAQESVPKEVLLTTLNSVNELKLSNLMTQQLMEYNKGYVDKIYEITDSDKSEKDKEAALKVLSNDSAKDLGDLLGKHYNKYAKMMSDEMKPLIKKAKYLKYLY